MISGVSDTFRKITSVVDQEQAQEKPRRDLKPGSQRNRAHMAIAINQYTKRDFK